MSIAIPAIDLLEGKVVRLRQGDFAQSRTYSDQPLELAKQWYDMGFTRLHLVDLDGARLGRPVHLPVLEQIAQALPLHIDYGGGLRSSAALLTALSAGATQVTVGSLAVEQPQMIREFMAQAGAECLLLAADIRQGRLVSRGWTSQTNLPIEDFLANWEAEGVQEVFVTDVAQDGMLQGPHFALYEQLAQSFPKLRILASGGVRGPGDVVALGKIGCSGAIVGKALYEEVVPRMRWVELNKTGTYVG